MIKVTLLASQEACGNVPNGQVIQQTGTENPGLKKNCNKLLWIYSQEICFFFISRICHLLSCSIIYFGYEGTTKNCGDI